MSLQEHLVPAFEPVAAEDAVVAGPTYRITVLTPRLVRLEHSPDGTFEDRPSQLVWYRDQPVPEFTVERADGTVELETDALRLTYDHGAGEGFAPETLSAELADGTVWQYGDEGGTLGGALRTLDNVDGSAPVEPGLLSRDGWTVVDDTDRLVFDDEWVTPREAPAGYEDLYFFGYGRAYRACLEDFTAIAGKAPLVPRWALGTWWSRYREYSQDDLRDLLTAFKQRGLPLSVCVIDMDWHVVDNPHHSGWTGWTWEESLFPDPADFIDWLHDEGVRTTLNLHPAQGVHPHETQYEAFAEDVGIDPERSDPIAFDATDTEFLRGYVEHLLHPLEDEDGIDFWWIDWQQGDESAGMAGLDPLWALNHIHALDRTRDGRRPFILSRWADLGGHRYPVGFSGDTYVSWASLRFQPFLTATSAGVDFGWWSHDIGGHMGGTADPQAFGELYARWTQFGALSPINRIHTMKSRSVDKRPWTFPGEVADALGDALRFRHRLIPYLYTMAWRDHTESVPLVRPMYLHHPEADAAYETPHQYYLGSELVAAPHLRERDDDTNLSRRSVWLPDGEWFDFRSGEHYEGDAWHARYGDLDDLPLYAPAGAIVPLGPDVDWGGIDSPETLTVVAFPGADNSVALYEDDGTSLDHRGGAYATTPLSQTTADGRLTFEIGPVEGDLDQVPDERDYELQFRGVVDLDAVEVTPDVLASDVRYRAADATLVVDLAGVDATEGVTITLDADDNSLVDRRDRTDRHVEHLLSNFAMPAAAKDGLLAESWDSEDLDWLGEYLQAMTPSQRRALCETLTGAGVDLLDHDGEERAVVWNPDGRDDVRFQYTAWGFGPIPPHQDGDYDAGPVPEWRTFDTPEELDATVAVTFADTVTVSCESSADGD